MKITGITAEPLRVPLKKPFVTALRSANAIENILVTVRTDEPELTGYGEAAAIPAVTGETAAGITGAVLNHIAPLLIGRPVSDFQTLSGKINEALRGNTSAKAGVETALFDLFAKSLGVPLYRLLGGDKDLLPENNITVSAGDVSGMIQSCLDAADDGFLHIKVKLGKTPAADYETLVRINGAVNGGGDAAGGNASCEANGGAAAVFEKSCGVFVSVPPELPVRPSVSFRVDGNCGWTAKEAVRLIRRWEDAGVPVEWVEQPVPGWDTDGLRFVTQNTGTPIMADESCFGERDAIRLLESRAADWINVKLAKAGGIGRAMGIAKICEAYRVPCMMGCMLESRVGTTAAAHAAATGLFKAVDLDGPLLCCDTGIQFPNGENLAHFSGPRIELK